jgi:hypothetical protein
MLVALIDEVNSFAFSSEKVYIKGQAYEIGLADTFAELCQRCSVRRDVDTASRTLVQSVRSLLSGLFSTVNS